MLSKRRPKKSAFSLEKSLKLAIGMVISDQCYVMTGTSDHIKINVIIENILFTELGLECEINNDAVWESIDTMWNIFK